MPTENIAADLPSRQFEPRVYGVGAWTPHLHFAYDLVALMRPRLLAELGTDRGESYFAFCQSVAENKTATRCFAIDTWQGDEQAGQYDETTFAQIDAHNRAHYLSFSTLMRCRFDAALEGFSDASIDLLHLDGLHSEEAVRHDLNNWLPKLRPGGLLLLHDVNVRSRDFGVWKLWDELRAHGRSHTFDDGPGLAVWQKLPNESLPEPLEILFSGPAPGRSMLVDYYRSRAAQLQEKIGREWRDGTVGNLSFLQQTVIQVFHTSDGVYREEESLNARIGHEGWKEVAVVLPADRAISGIRIDFVSPLTKIEIASLTVETKPGAVLFRAATAGEFESISPRGDCVRLALAPLTIQVTGLDPQLYLPPLSQSPEARGGIVVRIRLRVTPTASPIVR